LSRELGGKEQNNFGYKEFGKRLILRFGHIGIKHVSLMIKKYLYFANMYKMIDYCSKCEVCIKNKTRRGRESGSLEHLGPATSPFEIMSLDTVRGFGGRRSTKRYLHLLVDHFSRYAYIYTSANQTAVEMIKLILTLYIRAC